MLAPLLAQVGWLHTPQANRWAFQRGYHSVIAAQHPVPMLVAGRWIIRYRMCHRYDRWHPEAAEQTCRRMAAEDGIPSRAYQHYRQGWRKALAEVIPQERYNPQQSWSPLTPRQLADKHRRLKI